VPARRSVTAVAKTAPITLGDPGTDPTVTGGRLRIVGATFDLTFDLPPSRWRALGGATPSGFAYADKPRAHGPVTAVQVKRDKIFKVTAKGPGLALDLAASPYPVTVVLTIGHHRHCLSFGGDVRFRAGRSFKATGAPAPAACTP
jgi:hypothetical protein